MNTWFSRNYVKSGLLSIACPILTVLGVLIYQSITHTSFWEDVSANPQDDANRNAAVLMGLAEIFTLFFATGISCVIGLIFSLFSLSQQKKIFGIGLVGLIINAFPLALFLFLFVGQRLE